MSPAEVLTDNPSNAAEHSINPYESDEEFESTVAGRISAFGTNKEETSVSKLPGTSLLKSVHKPRQGSLVSSNHTLQSDKTYDFDKKYDPYDSLTEFGEDSIRSVSPDESSPAPIASASAGERVPAWKLRQQALRKNAPPPPKHVVESSTTTSPQRPGRPNNFRRSPLLNLRKPNPETVTGTAAGGKGATGDPNADKTWLQRLTTKKETEENKKKRIRRESLIEKQVSSRWGKDILEEDSDEDEEDKEKEKEAEGEKEGKDEADDANDDGNDGDDESEKPVKNDDESDTVKKVRSIIEKSFGTALIATIKKDKEAKSPDDSVFAKDAKDGKGTDDDDDEDAEKKSSRNRENRWAKMGSAAMTSVRNLIGDGEKKKTDEDATGRSESIVEEDENDTEDKDKDEDDDKIKEMKNRRSFMWKNKGAAAFTSVRNTLEGASLRRKSILESEDDGGDADDEKFVQSEPDRLDREENQNKNNLFVHIGNFVRYHRARLDAEVWADPEIQESLGNIEKLKTKLQDRRTKHRSVTRRREKQVENSITQQKIHLARKLYRLTYGYKKDPFHPCIKEVYEKEIRIIVHEATSLFGDADVEFEKDDIDDLLDSSRFEDDPVLIEDTDNATTKSGDGSIIDQFFRKTIGDDRSVDTLDDDSILVPGDGHTLNRDSLIPLETRLLRAQHNEWMTKHQMDIARTSQQKMVAYFIDRIPELRDEHEKIKAIPQTSVDAKIRELEESNAALKKAYEAHLEAQEKMLAIYRERYVPSEHEDDDKEDESVTKKDKTKETNDDDDDDDDENGEKDDTFGTPPATPTKQVRPNMWAKNISQSVRGLFGPKKDEKDGDKAEGNDDPAGDNSQIDHVDEGFSLASPLTAGSSASTKFLLSFGSPAGSAARSGILANFIAPPLTTATTTTDGDAHTDAKDSTARQSLQESAAESAEAAWKVPDPADKGSLPETAAEKRSRRAAERAAARKANRPDAVSSGGGRTAGGAAASTSSTSRSALLERARKARQESNDALKSNGITSPGSPTPSSRSGRTSLRSAVGTSAPAAGTTSGSSSRKELSMKDLLEKAGDSRRKLQENDSRMERLAHRKSQLNSPGADGASIGSSSTTGERRRRIERELKSDDSLRFSAHSLHERKQNPRSTGKKKPWETDDDDINEDELKEVDEFGGEAKQ
eukprot:CAMPEP_0197182676 /NCGR_PEP_ID=MMETSP1423-20130617/6555_1 /TAXON_ID=476441 /ORGANISM="Pseudo-nitzschia heimii, Strain UNC1101" /LENGTH=1169 /DNA_ID=CAMNT_0042633131 /DNA_START=326 /DNA_END=3835 /DNA_ORIENTATION=+